jgi:hypothetical protein
MPGLRISQAKWSAETAGDVKAVQRLHCREGVVLSWGFATPPLQLKEKGQPLMSIYRNKESLPQRKPAAL